MNERLAAETTKRASGSLSEAAVELIGPSLSRAEQILLEELASPNPYVADILQHVTRFQGKRLRPMLLLLTAEACGGIRADHETLAAVVEMIHLATLVHDDVLDEAETRRHVATINARWNNETSVLFGDYLFTHAFHLASSLDTTYACRAIGRATNLVCAGELTQVRERGNLNLSEDAYFRIIEGKTAELTAVSSHLGAYYSEATTEVVLAMERYGRNLGLAFQIADDVLDLVGNEKSTGKSLGSDLEKQKLTLPIIRLLAHAPESQRQAAREILAAPADDAREQLRPILEANGSIEDAQRTALGLAQQARRELDRLAPSRARRLLAEIADFAVQRNF